MRCPTCKREFDPVASTAKPFCCERCRLIDLGRWLGEDFALPASSQAETDDQAEPPVDDPDA